MRTLKAGLVVLMCLSALWVVSGCSARGPAFVPLSSVPAGKGVVYVYRLPKFLGSGVYGTLSANGTPVTKMRNGGYFPYLADPGQVHFEAKTEVTNAADVDVSAGQEKYLKTVLGAGLIVGHLKLTEVSREIGAAEITKCRLLEALP